MTHPRQTPSRRAAIVGGSMAGLFSALLLARAGFEIDIFERNPEELAGRGAGIVTHPALLRALEAAGLSAGEAIGVPVEGRRIFAADGSTVAEMPFPQTNTSWDHLFRRLRALVPEGRYHLGKEAAGVAQDDEGVSVSFADGTKAQADLVVAADGFRSAIRPLFLPDRGPVYAGYVAWRGLVEEADLSPAAVEALFSEFTFCLPPGEQILTYPVSGADNNLRPGHRRLNYVWYRPAAKGPAFDRLLTDDHGRTHSVSIPPPLISKAVIAEMREAAERLFPPVLVEAVERTGMPFFQPIYDLTVPRMAFGKVAILGDAAFVARPHVGAGVTKAAEDSMALAAALGGRDDISAALSAFEAARLPADNRIVQHGRDLGSSMKETCLDEAERRQADHYRDPKVIMQETASLEFLEAA